jgi:LCP family protein required for cell wall assembly
MLAVDLTPRRRRRRVPSLLAALAVTTAAGATGIVVAGNRVADSIARVDGVAAVLSPPSADVENYLLVGSDSRAGADPNDPDFGGIGTENDVSGRRSDTIMVLRRDRRGGPAALLSIPRDLYVDVPGHSGKRRINSAYNDGPATLVQTVQQSLGIPVHHYVEIDFPGFKRLVDSLGGVVVCFPNPTLDVNTGLNIPTPGCWMLDGVQALAYARSRYYTEYIDGRWVRDPTSDLGRARRQRDFVDRAVQGALARVKTDPFSAGRMARAIGSALRIDTALDPIDAAGSLRTAMDRGLATYSLPVVGRTIDGNAVLLLGDGADVVLDWFRGVSTTAPPPD